MNEHDRYPLVPPSPGCASAQVLPSNTLRGLMGAGSLAAWHTNRALPRVVLDENHYLGRGVGEIIIWKLGN